MGKTKKRRAKNTPESRARDEQLIAALKKIKRVEYQRRATFEELRRVRGELRDAIKGSAEVTRLSDAVLIETAIAYGTEEELDGRTVYRLALPKIDVNRTLERCELWAQKEDDSYVLYAGRRENFGDGD